MKATDPKKKRYTVWVDPELVKRLKSNAVMEGKTSSEMLEAILQERYPSDYIINDSKFKIEFVEDSTNEITNTPGTNEDWKQ